MSRRARTASMLALFTLGLAAGVFAVLAPFVVGFPTGAGGEWTAAVRSSLWAGAGAVVAAALALLALPAVELIHAARRED